MHNENKIHQMKLAGNMNARSGNSIFHSIFIKDLALRWLMNIEHTAKIKFVEIEIGFCFGSLAHCYREIFLIQLSFVFGSNNR